MPAGGERLQTVLDGYAKFLRKKDLALPKHQPYLVRWVREFLVFALRRKATPKMPSPQAAIVHPSILALTECP